MEQVIPSGMRMLGRVADIPENGAKGFPSTNGAFTGLVAIRQGDQIYIYENACPHIGTPLDWTPNRFLSADGRHLICATHGAEFTIITGVCISGPCKGDQLTPVNGLVHDGAIFVAQTG